MQWVALLISTSLPPPSSPSSTASSTELPATAEALRGLALWCLQFTPRVALVEGVAVVMELESSLRLFKGLAALKARISDEAPDLGVQGIGWAPTAMGALVMARCGVLDLGDRLLQPVLDELPLTALSAAAVHAETLTRAGINTLGELRALPRGGVSRRFDAQLLAAMDQAYGLRAEVFAWQDIPETFSVRAELPAREDRAPALLAYARPLLMQMCGWLAARHAGATGFTLRWVHDSMRAKDAGEGGELTIRSSEALRDLEHFVRLLAEHLAKLQLIAPVGELRLEALGVERVTEQSLSLLPQSLCGGESLALVLERIAARLGPERVLQPYLVDDHRADWATHWGPVLKRRARRQSEVPELPAPTFLLDEPLKLAVRDHRPHYQGPLMLLVGPDRVEGGWWDRLPGTSLTRHVMRDYWVAQSQTAGALWVYSTRMDDGELAWFLHGVFA
ncbi:MAG: Y-family DNA polymerase [Roseateles asaccharophilus]|uniref:Y-family DNA polymerase n=1 Tax=Roseateles asaccharophilus TaxID=582607 RepID=UPI003919D93A